jgi:hypothetical protein
MRMLSNKILTWYMRERTMEHNTSRLYRNLSEKRKQEIEKQKRHMSDAHVKIQRNED